MDYPQLPANLKHASYSELTRAEMSLRQYKNITILGIKHWRAIPQLCDAAKEVNKDQRRVMREIKARPEFHRVILPSPESRELVKKHVAAQAQKRTEQINTGDRVHSKFHDADGVVIRIEWSARVGVIYHVRLDNGSVVFCHVSDLSRLGNTELEESQ